MSDDAEQAVFVPPAGKKKYHTNEQCPRLRGKTKSGFTRELAEAWGMEECSHCGGVQSPPDEYNTLRQDLIDADPEDLGLSPEGERASASLSFVAWWLLVIAICTASVVVLYCGGAFA